MRPISHTFKPPLFFVINGGSGRRNLDVAQQAIESAMHLAARKHRSCWLSAYGQRAFDGTPRQCVVERWDYDDDPDEFEKVDTKALRCS